MKLSKLKKKFNKFKICYLLFIPRVDVLLKFISAYVLYLYTYLNMYIKTDICIYMQVACLITQHKLKVTILYCVLLLLQTKETRERTYKIQK